MIHTISWTKAECDYRVSDQQNSLRAHSQRTDFEQHRIHILVRSSEHATPPISMGRLYLESVSKFILELRSHCRFRPSTRQEQVILEVYDLRENRQLLVKVFGEFRRSSVRWDELKFRSVNGLATPLHVYMCEVVRG